MAWLGLAVVVAVIALGVRAAFSGPAEPTTPPLPGEARELLTRLGFEELDDACWTRDERSDGAERTFFFDLPDGDPPYQNLWIHTRSAGDFYRPFLGTTLMAWPAGSEPRWNIDDGDDIQKRTAVLESGVQVRIEVEGAPLAPEQLEKLVNLVRPRGAALAQLPKGYLELEFELQKEERLEWKLNLYWAHPQVQSPEFDTALALLTAAADDVPSILD